MLPIWLASAIETESDRNKMEQLYDEYERLLYSVALNYLHNSYKAEDAVHDTFLRIIDHLDKIDSTKSPRTRGFLVTVIENICINMLNSKSNTAEISVGLGDQMLVEMLPDTYIGTEDSYFEKYEVSRIADAIHKLPDILCNSLLLYAVHGKRSHQWKIPALRPSRSAFKEHADNCRRCLERNND